MTTRPLPRRCVVAASGLGLVLAPLVAGAQGTGVDLRIDCPAIDDASRAVLEARARAELTAAALAPGTISVVCAGGAATLEWRPHDGARRTSTVSLGSEPADRVEPLLAALVALVLEPPETSAAPSTSTPAPAPAPTPTPTPTSNPAPTPPGPDGREPVEPPRRGVGLLLGADSELWSGAVAGAVGGHAGVRLHLPGGWSAVVTGGALWGTSSADGVTGQAYRATVGASWDVLRALRLGVGADARVLLAARAGSPDQNAATAGAVASLRYVVALGAISVSAGPEAELLVGPLIVQVAGGEVFRIPRALLGLAVEVGADLGH